MTVDGEVVGAIGAGLCVFVGVTHSDGPGQVHRMVDKIATLRVMAGPRAGVGDLSIRDVGGEVLVVSQFTLYGSTRKGRRPSWVDAARPEHAEPLVEALARGLQESGLVVATGVFGAHMDVELVNDGPVTLMLELD